MTSCILCTRFGCSSEPWFWQHFCASEKVKLFSSCLVNKTVGGGGAIFMNLWLLSMSSSQLVLSFYFCFRDLPPFILPSGVHIECSMCAQPASKEVKWQKINWIYCAWLQLRFVLITVRMSWKIYQMSNDKINIFFILGAASTHCSKEDDYGSWITVKPWKWW